MSSGGPIHRPFPGCTSAIDPQCPSKTQARAGKHRQVPANGAVGCSISGPHLPCSCNFFQVPAVIDPEVISELLFPINAASDFHENVERIDLFSRHPMGPVKSHLAIAGTRGEWPTEEPRVLLGGLGIPLPLTKPVDHLPRVRLGHDPFPPDSTREHPLSLRSCLWSRTGSASSSRPPAARSCGTG